MTRILMWAVLIAALFAPPAAVAADGAGITPAIVVAQDTAPAPSTYDLRFAALVALRTIASAVILALPKALNEWAKRAIVAAIAAILSVAGLYYSSQLDTTDWGRTWLLVFLGAAALYTLLYKPLAETMKGSTG